MVMSSTDAGIVCWHRRWFRTISMMRPCQQGFYPRGLGGLKVNAPSNGPRLSCGALVKDSSFNTLRAPSASSAC
jgi:hypothetical protein